jgi:phage shock protein PspC (stress-responsive transcriptional regulator)
MTSKEIKDETSFERVIKGEKSYNVLMKDAHNASWGGVLSGFGKRFGLNVTLLRTLTVIAGFMTGFTAVFVYAIFSWFILPEYNKLHDQKFIEAKRKRNVSSDIVDSVEDITINKKKKTSVTIEI